MTASKRWAKRPVKRVGKTYEINHEAFTVGLHIFCDGACEPNPGPGGWGVVTYRDGVELSSLSGGEPDTTNNRMELTSLLAALGVASGLDEPCVIWCDSQYAVTGANEWSIAWKRNGWQRGGPNADPKNRVLLNAEIWRAIDAAKGTAPMAKIKWCKGHAGIAGNERADELSTQGLSEALGVGESGDYLTDQYRMMFAE
ncbi:ribonuclease H [Rhizobium sp. EC-SD404]|uniref:ribonuclease H family protein n=1 Tax=Rhizobium sp. EC-SD404 TaxID=2038389 RepID=UPI001253F15A|nr:ribonuclease H [Rhizobium sp. EC-SD404]VVT04732.1 Ribonuclease H (modular protein) [Rhizobium sp. EC-SD404]